MAPSASESHEVASPDRTIHAQIRPKVGVDVALTWRAVAFA